MAGLSTTSQRILVAIVGGLVLAVRWSPTPQSGRAPRLAFAGGGVAADDSPDAPQAPSTPEHSDNSMAGTATVEPIQAKSLRSASAANLAIFVVLFALAALPIALAALLWRSQDLSGIGDALVVSVVKLLSSALPLGFYYRWFRRFRVMGELCVGWAAYLAVSTAGHWDPHDRGWLLGLVVILTVAWVLWSLYRRHARDTYGLGLSRLEIPDRVSALIVSGALFYDAGVDPIHDPEVVQKVAVAMVAVIVVCLLTLFGAVISNLISRGVRVARAEMPGIGGLRPGSVLARLVQSFTWYLQLVSSPSVWVAWVLGYIAIADKLGHGGQDVLPAWEVALIGVVLAALPAVLATRLGGGRTPGTSYD